jgi:hypothetical protein
MDLNDIAGSLVLRGRQALRLDDDGGRRIAVLEGHVWITQKGDSRDFVLGAGESFVADRPVDAVVSALDGGARIILEDGADAAPRRALGLRGSMAALARSWSRFSSLRRPDARRRA